MTIETKPYILGLDLGPNSLGWAVLGKNGKDPSGIVRAGVRVFEMGVKRDEKGKEESHAAARRTARGMRRRLWRHVKRLNNLFRVLQDKELLPSTPEEKKVPRSLERHEVITKLDESLRAKYKENGMLKDGGLLPYFLRDKALREKLELEEIGRALYHICQRRGFRSNRKTDSPDDAEGEKSSKKRKKDRAEAEPRKDTKAKVKPTIEKLKEELGGRTLGEHLYGLSDKGERLRGEGRYTGREMYLHEFERIWDAQQKHYPKVLTDKLKKAARKAIFHQRPLKSARHLVGKCELESTKRKAPGELLISQEFRILQKVNDLRVKPPGEEKRKLTNEERAKLIAALDEGDLTFAAIRKHLDLGKAVITLEYGGETKIPGNRTAEKIRAVLGDRWDAMSREQQDTLVDEWRSIRENEALARRLMGSKWKFDEETAKKFSKISLEEKNYKYCAYSKRALEGTKDTKGLLEYMRNGMSLGTAIDKAYPNHFKPSGDKGREFLPPLKGSGADDALRNPIVARALTETRKVVNAILKQHGKPDEIRIELGRDLRQPKKQREETWKRMRQNQNERESARQTAKERLQKEPSNDDIEKVLLWKELRNGPCPYCGERKVENIGQLFDGTWQVEHIIPRSRSLDDSFLNKTLACVPCNNRKNNRTPYEAFGSNPAEWNDIFLRVEQFETSAAKRRPSGKGAKKDEEKHHPKLYRFKLQGKDLEEFLSNRESRQLNDMRYASKLAKRYLGLLYGSVDDDGKKFENGKWRKCVQAARGGITSYLRGLWKIGKKNRDDHRHHAEDAILIALTDDGKIKMIQDTLEKADTYGTGSLPQDAPPPWLNFRNDARAAIDSIIVSHRVNRKVSGRLHEDTNYSPPRGEDGHRTEGGKFAHVRKSLSSLTKASVKDIVDKNVREKVLAALGDGEPKKVFSNPENLPFFTAKKDGRKIPIRKARIKVVESIFPVGGSKGEPRWVKSDSNHHLEIVGKVNQKDEVVEWLFERKYLVNTLEAQRRLRAGEPVVKRDHREGEKFLFSLANHETIEIDEPNGGRGLYQARTVSRAGDRPYLTFVRINVAGKAGKALQQSDYVNITDEGIAKRCTKIDHLSSLNCRKVLVTPLGEVREAHD